MAERSSTPDTATPAVPTSTADQVALLAQQLRQFAEKVQEEARTLDEAMGDPGLTAEDRRLALNRFGAVVKNTQHFMAGAERVRGQTSGQHRSVERAYWDLHAAVQDGIASRAGWRKHLAATHEMLSMHQAIGARVTAPARAR